MTMNDEEFRVFCFWWFSGCAVFLILWFWCQKVVCAEENTEETPTSPTFRNNVAIIRTEHEQRSSLTSDRHTNMPMPPHPIGWSATGSNPRLYQPISAECPYPPQLPYPVQMPYQPQDSNLSPRSSRTLPYPSPSNTNSNLSSGSNVPQPSAPYPTSKSFEEMDSPPNFEEAMKMCPKK